MKDIDLPDGIVVTGCGVSGPILQIDTSSCSARLSLRGGQVLDWRPAANEPVLWLSNAAAFEPGKAIRGGIPVCWPWFGEHADDPAKPSHGFARIRDWQLTSAAIINGEAHLHLTLPADPRDIGLWPHSSRPALKLVAGETLQIGLSITNNDQDPITISQALHTYFAVSDIAEVTVTGLENRSYYDKLTNTDDHLQNGTITFDGEVDRIYRHDEGQLKLRDHGLKRTIALHQTGGSSIIVWNPWIEKSRRLSDMGNDEAYRGMVCIETGSVADKAVTLDPGKSHDLGTVISVTAS